MVAPHTFPVPPPTYSGEVVIYDLARSLDEMGHQVDLYAPAESWKPPHGNLFPMPCSYGAAWPSSEEAEQQTWASHRERLLQADLVHDFSHTKGIAELLYREDHRRNAVSTLLSSLWDRPRPPFNIVVWSQAMRDRGLRGATDYENTPFPEIDGLTKAAHNSSITDAHVIHGGIDTEFYHPGTNKDGYFLWLGRWSRQKGYHIAIELARRTTIPLVVAGLRPNDTWDISHKQHAVQALELAKGLPNIQFEWLPRDPPEAHHDRKRCLLQAAKAMLFTIQFQEPFGLGQIEALACGTPVIGTNFGSVSEMVQHGRTGFVCNTMEDLEAAVREVGAIDPEECRRVAVARFDRYVMAKAYLTEYQKVMEGEGWGT